MTANSFLPSDDPVDCPEGPGASFRVKTRNAQIVATLTTDECWIGVAGELDAANSEAFFAVLERARERAPQRIVIDASELDFLSVGCARQLDARNDVVVVNAYGIVKRVLDLLTSIACERTT